MPGLGDAASAVAQYVPPMPGMDATEQQLFQWLLNALTKVQQNESGATDKVIQALTNGKGQEAIADEATAQWKANLLDEAAQTYKTAFLSAAGASLSTGAPGLLFDVPLPQVAYARAWAADHAAQLVTSISEQQRLVIGQVIDQSLDEGWSIPKTAKAIGHSAGLTERQATALGNYRAGLEAQGLPDHLVDARTQAYSNRLHGQRAKAIARTETSFAANAGRYKGWLLATMSGALAPDALKEWLTSPGSCPECTALSGKQVQLPDDFPDVGPMPPAHPNCRCTAIIADPGTIAGPKGTGWSTGQGSPELAPPSVPSGLPGAPAHAVPVTEAKQIDPGDKLWANTNGTTKGPLEVVAGEGWEGVGGTIPAGHVQVKLPGGKFANVPIAPSQEGPELANPLHAKKPPAVYAIEPGPAKAEKAAQAFQGTPGASLPKGAPPDAFAITKNAQAHPGDLLYDSKGVPHQVLGAHPDGGLLTITPDGKKHQIDLDKGSKVGKSYGLEPSTNKGAYLAGAPPDGVKLPGPWPEHVPMPPKAEELPWQWAPSPGDVTGHVKFPGNSYGIVSIDGDKAVIQTMAGSKFKADLTDLVGLPPGLQVQVGGEVKTVVGVEQYGSSRFVKFHDGTTIDLGDAKFGIGPHTATPGGGAAAGAAQHATPAAPKGKAPSGAKAPSGKGTPPAVHADGTRTPGVREAAKEWAPWVESLTPAEKAALRDYTGGAYASINKRLRSGGKPTKADKAAADGLAKHTVTGDDLMVHRGTSSFGKLSASQAAGLKPGTTFMEPGFTSTSVGGKAAFSDKDIILRIRVPQGFHGGYVDTFSQFRGEHEFLLPPRTEFRLEATSWGSGGKLYMDVTVINQGGLL